MKLKSRLRIEIADGLTLDSTKVELLELIHEQGSLSAAQRKMGLTYRNAWLHIDSVNRMFPRKVVVSAVGGKRGGGAYVTELGRSLAAAYRRAERRSAQAVEDEVVPLMRR
jgi:molybdate transport system regulatory protein